MKDIPVFATEYGVASLIFREIPYSGAAYIKVQSSEALEELLRECEGFCRAAGARTIYACGHPDLRKYPFYTAIYRMERATEGLPDTEAMLFPVQEQTLEDWRTLYNTRMADIPNAAWMTENDAKQMLQKGDGYFIFMGKTLLGIGRASKNQIDVVISAVDGGGYHVLLALCHAISSDFVYLEVASTNERAMRLYEKLGFSMVSEKSRWYKIH